MTTKDQVVPVAVFKNEVGDYFLVPRATLEQCRVPAEHTAELEQVMTAAAAQGSAGGEDDVQGHALPAAIWFAGVILEGVVIGYAAARETGTLKGLKPR